jgi:hypothetical protein
MKYIFLVFSSIFILTINVNAEDRLELETTFIKGNKELPQIIYIVPWKDIKSSRKKQQKIVLYSLFGDLFDPVNPEELNHKVITE